MACSEMYSASVRVLSLASSMEWVWQVCGQTRPPPPSAGTPALESDSPLRSPRLRVHENAGGCLRVAHLLPEETCLGECDHVPTICPPVPSHGRPWADDAPVGTRVGNCRRCRPFGPSPCPASYPERTSGCLLSVKLHAESRPRRCRQCAHLLATTITSKTPVCIVQCTARVGSPLPPAGRGGARRGARRRHGRRWGGRCSAVSLGRWRRGSPVRVGSPGRQSDASVAAGFLTHNDGRTGGCRSAPSTPRVARRSSGTVVRHW